MEDFFAFIKDANKIHKWFANDTESEFNKNIEKFPEFFKKYNWNKDSITYKFNTEGFRSDSFNNNSKSILFLGCSHTFGVGINYTDTFAKIVSNELNLDCFNLGMPGGSNDTCFRFGYYWIPKLLPKVVVYVVPQLHRFELKIQDKFVNFFPNKMSTYNKINTIELYKQWACEEINVTLQTERNLNAIKYICQQNNIKLRITHSGFPNNNEPKDLARDMLHYGIKSNMLKAKEILDMIEGENHFHINMMR